MATFIQPTQNSPSTKRRDRLFTAWIVLRLPLLALLLFGVRQELLELVERVMGVGGLTIRVISLLSTLSERLLLFAIGAAGLTIAMALAQRVRSVWGRFLLPVAIALGGFWAMFTLLPTNKAPLLAGILAILLAVNTLPDGWLRQQVAQGKGRKLADLGFGLGVGVAEFLLPKPFLLWLLTRLHGRDVVVMGRRRGLLDLLPIVLVSALAAFVTSTPALVELGWNLHRDPAVQRFARGDVNMLAFNPIAHRLYVSGHGLNHLQAYDTRHLSQPPQESITATGYAQGFFYNSSANELYVYNTEIDSLLLFDGSTLKLTRTIATPHLSPGDPWIVWDRFSDHIIIASEADRQEGTPFVVVDRAKGQVIETKDLSPSYLYLHPEKPLLYMNFFRRTTDLLLYDTQRNQMLKQVPTDKQVDRMAIVPSRNELLVSSPVNSQVLRYDADTLERKGAIATVFGVRTVALDASRDLLLTGSLATNMLEAIDLKTEKRVAQFRLGPWLREICLDTEAGVAYVSSNGAIFKVNYAEKL